MPLPPQSPVRATPSRSSALPAPVPAALRAHADSPHADPARAYRRRARRADVLVTALWSSGAVAVALFLAAGGAGQFTSAAESITSLGIIAGLLGTDFVLVMLVLAARIPLLDRTIGHDRAIAVHRSLGKPALYLLLAHGALLLTGYGLSQGIDPIAEIGPMLALPDLPLAVLALGLLVTVVVASLVAVRRRLSYEVWHGIHLLSYLAVAGALPHQLSAGGILAEGTAQRTYWLALTALAFGSIAWFRFARPLIASLRHRVTVAAVTVVGPGPGAVSIQLTGRDLRRLGSAGGQFFIWRFWSRATWWHAHPISLSSMPTDFTARITVRDLGAGSAALAHLRPGTRVGFEGPYGLFTDAARTTRRLALVAAGIGITPIRTLLEDARFAPGEATVLLRATTADDTALWEEVRAIADAKGAAFYTSVGRRAHGDAAWLSTDDAARGVTLQSVFPALAESDLYLCGPSAWLDAVEREARRSGVQAHRIHAERFDW